MPEVLVSFLAKNDPEHTKDTPSSKEEGTMSSIKGYVGLLKAVKKTPPSALTDKFCIVFVPPVKLGIIKDINRSKEEAL